MKVIRRFFINNTDIDFHDNITDIEHAGNVVRFRGKLYEFVMYDTDTTPTVLFYALLNQDLPIDVDLDTEGDYNQPCDCGGDEVSEPHYIWCSSVNNKDLD